MVYERLVSNLKNFQHWLILFVIAYSWSSLAQRSHFLNMCCQRRLNTLLVRPKSAIFIRTLKRPPTRKLSRVLYQRISTNAQLEVVANEVNEERDYRRKTRRVEYQVCVLSLLLYSFRLRNSCAQGPRYIIFNAVSHLSRQIFPEKPRCRIFPLLSLLSFL